MFFILIFMIFSIIFGLFYDKYLHDKYKIICLCCSVIAAIISLTLLKHVDLVNLSTHLTNDIFTWLELNSQKICLSFRYDTISSIWVITVSILSAFTSFYSVKYMKFSKGKLIALINLFAISMIILVSSNSLIQIYIGWELVTIVSYFLINFYNKTQKKSKEIAFKILALHKIGDCCLLFGILLIYGYYGSINLEIIQTGRRILGYEVYDISSIFILIAISIKSAQIGFMQWLKSAMIAPTPASAFLHSATVVSAGIFLLIRISGIININMNIKYFFLTYFLLSSLISAISALRQRDVKCGLACSTISEIGLILASVILGNYKFAILFFVIHSFAKVSLFFGIGNVINALFGERDLWKMGNLIDKLPKTYTAVLLSSLLLVGIIPAFIGSNELLGKNHFYTYFMFAISFLTIAYLSRLIYFMFHQPRLYDKSDLNLEVAENNQRTFLNLMMILCNIIVRGIVFFSIYKFAINLNFLPFISKILIVIIFMFIYRSKYKHYLELIYSKKISLSKINFNANPIRIFLTKVLKLLDETLFKRIYKLIYISSKNLNSLQLNSYIIYILSDFIFLLIAFCLLIFN